MKFKFIDLVSFNHDILTTSRNEVIEFGLNEGDYFTLDKGELFDVINILTSNEFCQLIDAHNYYEEWREEENIIHSMCIDDITNTTLYSLSEAASKRGYYEGVIETITKRICDSAPYASWYKARCMYESLTGIDRDLL